MDALSSLAAVVFFWASVLVYMFSLFGLTFMLLYEAKKSGPADPRLRTILEESIPIPDWQELRTILAMLIVVFATLTPIYLSLRPGAIVQLRWIYLGNIALLTCATLQIIWWGVYWRLRSQMIRRQYFLTNFKNLEFQGPLHLTPVSRLQRRLNIRDAVVESSGEKISLFYYTRSTNASGASGSCTRVPGLFGWSAPIFVRDENLNYLKSLT